MLSALSCYRAYSQTVVTISNLSESHKRRGNQRLLYYHECCYPNNDRDVPFGNSGSVRSSEAYWRSSNPTSRQSNCNCRAVHIRGLLQLPPADNLLRQINDKETDTGELVIGISEHVTYWNYLGWSDPFSAKVFSERQSAYAQRFHLSSVYMPQMVIDGEEQIVGSDRSGLLQALRKEQAPKPIAIHISAVTIHGQELTFNYLAVGKIPETARSYLQLWLTTWTNQVSCMAKTRVASSPMYRWRAY